MEPRLGRKLIVDKAPNRLFLKYLAEWKDEAKERGDKSAYTYGKAHKTLQKYPLPLQCGAEAKILENFGDKICKMLDNRLAKDAEENDMSPSEFLEKSRTVPSSWWKIVNQETAVATKKLTKRRKVEKIREPLPPVKKRTQPNTISDMFGVAMTTERQADSQDSGISSTYKNNDIIDLDAVDDDSPSQSAVTTKKPTKRRKIEKIREPLSPVKKKTQSKTISDMLGVAMATERQADSQDSGVSATYNNNEVIDLDAMDDDSPSQSDPGYRCGDSKQPKDPSFVLYPGQFDVILCVDYRETMGDSRRREIRVELSKKNVFFEQRTLHVGDFLWIAQEKPSFCVGRKPRELVLDYVVERKIPSDLSDSIRDGRFREQKIRLKSSGIKNIIYLVENMKTIENQSLPGQTLRQAIYNTQIVDNFLIKYTKNAKSTVQYLNLMTNKLQKLYENCSLEAVEISDLESENKTSGVHRLMPFDDFNEMGSKQKKLTVKEMFLRQLMQIHGVSYDKASAVTAVYGTPMLLVQKYRTLVTVKEKEELLSKIKFGLTERNLGIAISRVICKVYSD